MWIWRFWLVDFGFHLSAEEFIAIRFHMGVRNKKAYFLYDDAVRSQLRYITTKADRISAGKDKRRRKDNQHLPLVKMREV